MGKLRMQIVIKVPIIAAAYSNREFADPHGLEKYLNHL